MAATYHVTGNGSAVIEELIVDGKPSMTSAYHLDKDDLRMTHYCAAANQPRLKASSIDLSKNLIRFDFVDITNLASPRCIVCPLAGLRSAGSRNHPRFDLANPGWSRVT